MATPMKIVFAPYTVIRVLTRLLVEGEVGASDSKKVSAFSGLRMALTPNPIAMVAPTLAAIRRRGEWEIAILIGGC